MKIRAVLCGQAKGVAAIAHDEEQLSTSSTGHAQNCRRLVAHCSVSVIIMMMAMMMAS